MPFIQQVINPVNLSRPDTNSERYRHAADSCDEFGYFVNFTLSNVLRQLASVLAVADGIFHDLNNELGAIRTRTEKVKRQIEDVDKVLEEYEMGVIHDRDRLSIDLLSIKTSYAPNRPIDTCLFTKETRSLNMEKLYAAATLQVPNIKETYNMPIVTPVLGHSRHRIKKRIDEEIETRLPETVRDLRKWTSTEAIGDITVRPHCISILDTSNIHHRTATCNDNTLYASISTSYIDGIDVTIVNDEVDYNDDVPLDHTLPSPEEQCETIAKKYPANFIEVDTSRSRFDRMSLIRRTIGGMPSATQKSLHERFPSVKIRTKPKRAAGKRRNTISGMDSTELKDTDAIHFDRTASCRQTTDFSIRSSLRFTQLKAIKQWGKHRLKFASLSSNNRESKTDTDIDKTITSTKSLSQERSANKQKKKSSDKCLKQNPLYLSPKNTFDNYFLPENTIFSATEINQVKMRDAVSSRRYRRSNIRGQRIEEINSSSGNWSASSESGRTSASSENTVQPKTMLFDGSTHSKRKLIDTSTPSRNGSSELSSRNGEISMNNRDLYDDENSSIYSCDTEGYFTSFHLDSGLKTTTRTNGAGIDCEYGLFGKSPILHSKLQTPELNGDDDDVDLDYELALFKKQLKNDSHALDNEIDMHFSNSTEFQLMDQESRIREKMLINSIRIPSMSEITPLNSDEDEQIVLESLLQTLNCKPLEVLARGTEKKRNKSIGNKNQSPPVQRAQTENSDKKNATLATRAIKAQSIYIVDKPINTSKHSYSLQNLSNLYLETNATKRITKYWTMPLIKNKQFLTNFKSFEHADGHGNGNQDSIPVILDKVPSKKTEKIYLQTKMTIADVKPTPTAKPIAPVKCVSINSSSTTSKNEYAQSNHNENNLNTMNEPKIVPKTTLLDFKKLLLSTAGKKNFERQSASELLKVAKEPPFPIQNLSYSPRALSNRRTIRQKHTSPVKKSNVMSPRSKWKYKCFDTNFITSIPEATNEEENASISSQDAATASSPTPLLNKTIAISDNENDLNIGISLRHNIFMQEEENNFMRGEVKKFTPIKILRNFEKKIDPFAEFRKNDDATISEVLSPLPLIDATEKSIELRPTLETSF